jgi:hypothetical protein
MFAAANHHTRMIRPRHPDSAIARAGDEEVLQIEVAVDERGSRESAEPPRLCRRPFRLSHAAIAGGSSMAE